MRINITDEEDFPGQFELWQANCHRSIHGKKGQKELREFEAALLALPEKRLIKDLLEDGNDVCAIGCYARYKGIDLSKFAVDDGSDKVGIAAGMPRLVAWSVVALNDLEVDCEYHASVRHDFTPEERYEKVLEWVRARIRR